jgi:hypothetical protein
MQPRCKKCGKPLRDPESIARGMGPECAGLSGRRGRSLRVRRRINTGSAYGIFGVRKTEAPLFAWDDHMHRQRQLPAQLAGFPPDLLRLVLSAPAAGAIATHLKRTRRKRQDQKGYSPGKTLREIRRTCINLRMLFWPGFSFKGEPLPCIPCGEDNWRIGKAGREISGNDLISYLSRYGAI